MHPDTFRTVDLARVNQQGSYRLNYSTKRRSESTHIYTGHEIDIHSHCTVQVRVYPIRGGCVGEKEVFSSVQWKVQGRVSFVVVVLL